MLNRLLTSVFGSRNDRFVKQLEKIVAKINALEPQIVGKARIGDIRHCFCYTTLAADRLDFTAIGPAVSP